MQLNQLKIYHKRLSESLKAEIKAKIERKNMSIDESKLLKIESVLEIVPVSKATWYRIIEGKKELKPLKIGRGSFWKESQIKLFVDNLEKENNES